MANDKDDKAVDAIVATLRDKNKRYPTLFWEAFAKSLGRTLARLLLGK